MAFDTLAGARFVAPDSPAILLAGGFSPERRGAPHNEQPPQTVVSFPPAFAFEPKPHRRPGLTALQRVFPDFDFASVRNIGFMRGSRTCDDEVRLIGDGARRICVRRKGCGDLLVDYTSAEGESRSVEVTPALRADLAQAFRLAAIRERTEALVKFRPGPAGSLVSSTSIEADFVDCLAWAARVDETPGGEP